MRLLLISMLLLATLPATAAPITRDALINADYAQGRRAFQQRCSACHALAEGSNDLIGPALYGVFARKTGAKPGFAFSPALKKAATAWTPDTLARWLADPTGVFKGNKMAIPEAVPEQDRVPLIAFMMLETGAADWPKPQMAAAPEEDKTKPLSERFPSFWNHLMTNTTRYKWVAAGKDLAFDVYYNTDGSVASNVDGVNGFWHVTERNMFCYALQGLPLDPPYFVQCFPIAAMAIPRFGENMWQSSPAKGVTLHGGIVAGRPAG